MFAFIFQFLANHFLFFALHFENRNVFPKPLSAKQEHECFVRMAEGDSSARDTLIEHNLRLVAHIIKKYYLGTQDQEDLISIGTIGLIKAVSTFDYTKGCRFATYGSRCVENEILMHFRGQKKTAGEVHFDEPIEVDRNGNQLTLMDIISDGVSVDDQIELNIKSEQLYKYIDDSLSSRERDIIVMRYGLDGNAPLTQREVAKKLGISRSYVSRIEKKALETLYSRFEPASKGTAINLKSKK